MHYNYFRDYDPAIGRYVQSDPIGLDGGLNSFAYAALAPLQSSDPSGLAVALPFPGLAGGGAIGLGIGIGIGIGQLICSALQPCSECVPPVGTRCYVGPHNHPNRYPQLGGATVHYHIYVRYQNPVSCNCGWKRDKKTYGKGAAVKEPPLGMPPCPPDLGASDRG